MKVAHVFEGLMKRSDPIISGEDTAPEAKSNSVKRTSFQTRVTQLAKAANVSEDRVKRLWDKFSAEVGDVDPRRVNKWAIITSKVKRELGLN